MTTLSRGERYGERKRKPQTLLKHETESFSTLPFLLSSLLISAFSCSRPPKGGKRRLTRADLTWPHPLLPSSSSSAHREEKLLQELVLMWNRGCPPSYPPLPLLLARDVGIDRGKPEINLGCGRSVGPLLRPGCGVWGGGRKRRKGSTL